MSCYQTRQLHRSTVRTHTGTPANVPEESISEDKIILHSPPTLSGDRLDNSNQFISDIRNFVPETNSKTNSSIKVFGVNIQDKSVFPK